MSEHFFDLLARVAVDPTIELRKLYDLFSRKEFFVDIYLITLEKYINSRVFSKLSFRGTFIDLNDMLTTLKLSEEELLGPPLRKKVPLKKLFLFCEFLLALFTEGATELRSNDSAWNQATLIIANINTIVDRTNHTLHDIGTENRPRYIIVENNKLVSQACEFITEQPVALAMIEYNHHALKGNTVKKRQILTELVNYVEPIKNSNILRENGYAQLQSDVGFVINNFHIRHNNKTGTNAKEYISALPDDELEKWYDKAYNLMLSVIVEAQNIRTHHEIEQLKKSYKW